MFQIYTRICIFVFIALSYEYTALNKLAPIPSLVLFLKKKFPYFKDLNPSPAAGHTISYWFGWIGFGFMVILLGYSFRKRVKILNNVLSLKGWLDFHIFCGLIGPIFIIFHTNFKVGGLVAISFWSMLVSAGSGIVGRYFYFQVLQNRGRLRSQLNFYDEGFKKLQVVQRINPAAIEQLKKVAIATACGIDMKRGGQPGFLTILFASIIGDIALKLRPAKLLPGMHRSIAQRLKEYAKIQRQIYFMDTYKQFMGYWHAFHLPFAIFMYIVAVIHIITALLFKVNA